MDKINTRSIIIDILTEINENGKYSNIILTDALKKYQYLDHADRAFISRCVMGTVERKITLDYVINSLSKIRVEKMKPLIRNVLRMSIYQIMYMDNIKEYAICNEAVKLVSKRGFVNLKGFVNGILRNVIRNRETLLDGAETDVIYSTPRWIVDMFTKNYGEENTKKILTAQFEDRPLSVRCNTTVNSLEELINRLNLEKVNARKSQLADNALYISGYDYLEKLNSFWDGSFCVQDISSMLVGQIANPEAGSYIVDVCAAPGGKSIHMAELTGPKGMVSSRDLSEVKVMKIEENIRHMGIKNIKTKVWDATVTDESCINSADVLIADLPCSGLGIFNKKPDIKYNATPEGCNELSKIQRNILGCVSAYVKKGGTLMYSTCTLNPGENIENLNWFVENYPFKTVDITDRLPEELCKDTAKKGYIEILPGVDSPYCDGFFIAKLIRE